MNTEESRQAAFLPQDEIAGIELRPFTMQSMLLCKAVGNKLVAGVAVDQIENPEFEVMAFIFIHSAPIQDVRRACRDKDRFFDAVMDYADTVKIPDFYNAAQSIGKILTTASASIVESVNNPTTGGTSGN